MSASTWGAYLLTFSLAVFSPGPDFLATLRTSLRYGRTPGKGVATGIATGTFIWVTATLLGIVTILKSSTQLAYSLRLIGAVFLALYGLRILWSIYIKPRLQDREKNNQQGSKAEIELASDVKSSSFLKGFRLGVLTNTVGNPKAVIFFSVIFVSMIPSDIRLWEASLLVAYMVVFPLCWFSVVAMIASKAFFMRAYQRSGWIIDTALALLFVTLGLLLIL